jgi:hypothetical protein
VPPARHDEPPALAPAAIPVVAAAPIPPIPFRIPPVAALSARDGWPPIRAARPGPDAAAATIAGTGWAGAAAWLRLLLLGSCCCIHAGAVAVALPLALLGDQVQGSVADAACVKLAHVHA